MTTRHPSDIEAELEGLRVYARTWPLMASYIEPKREALRMELRLARRALYVAPPVRPSIFRRFFAALLFNH